MDRVDPDELLAPHPSAREILERLEEAGYQAVVVGGAVRDLLRARLHDDLSFSPEEVDIDIATSAGTDEIKNLFKDYGFVEVGESFGVLVLVSQEGDQYEVAQFRTESGYDGRKPGDVAPAASLQEDVNRRDFTVNGMAMESDGTIIDYVGGIADLKKKKVRAIGDPFERFREDYLRPLRAIRIACYIDGTIERDTEEAIRAVAHKITEISWERIREELFNILETENAERGMRWLRDQDMLKEILPEMAANAGVPQPEEYHPEGGVLEHSFRALGVADRFRYPPLVKLAVFIHDVGKAKAFEKNEGEHLGGHALAGEVLAEQVASRLKLSNEEAKKLTWIVGNHMRGSILQKMRKAKQVKLVRTNQDPEQSLNDPTEKFKYFSDLLRTIIADSQASAHGVEGWLPVLKGFSSLLPHLKHLEELGSARELIDGNDLLELGMEEGPELGEVLQDVHERIFSGDIESRQGAIEAAEEIIESR